MIRRPPRSTLFPSPPLSRWGEGPGGPGAALAERLAAAAAEATAAMTAFAHDLERWLDTAGDEFALGEDDFNFHLHYERSEEHTSELQSRLHLVCRLLLEKKN